MDFVDGTWYTCLIMEEIVLLPYYCSEFVIFKATNRYKLYKTKKKQ